MTDSWINIPNPSNPDSNKKNKSSKIALVFLIIFSFFTFIFLILALFTGGTRFIDTIGGEISTSEIVRPDLQRSESLDNEIISIKVNT